MGKYQPILTIARCGSFNKAAGELGYSQPNLWHIVNNLEDDLGTKLFHRSRQGVSLTNVGKALLEQMERIEAQESSLHQLARTLHNNQLRVGLLPGLPGHWMAELLSIWHREYPELRIKLETPATCREGLKAVEDRLLDLCFSVLPGSLEAEAVTLWEDPYFLVINADHPLAEQERVSLRDVLGKCPLIPSCESFDPDSPLWDVTRRTDCIFMADSTPLDLQLSVSLAEKGMGAVLLPKLALEGLPKKSGVRCIPLSDGPTRTVTLLSRQKEEWSALETEIINSIILYFEEQRVREKTA